MDINTLIKVFLAVFVAELGDKTQLATMLFAADKEVSKLVVFSGAALALITTSAIGVLAGGFISRFFSEKILSIAAGLGFIAIGIWTLARVFLLAK
ncbi:MAG: TMEM165/GDT1 family protein [Elusimicrobia bacterium]|nr:TMEM165/GDT1 family protein [Candidatus Obscuribacterium magneticum]